MSDNTVTRERDGRADVEDEVLEDEVLEDELLEDELLVEEVSIDGMCGVY
jgi:mycofactocin precursor